MKDPSCVLVLTNSDRKNVAHVDPIGCVVLVNNSYGSSEKVLTSQFSIFVHSPQFTSFSPGYAILTAPFQKNYDRKDFDDNAVRKSKEYINRLEFSFKWIANDG
jgi:hypothetical protein